MALRSDSGAGPAARLLPQVLGTKRVSRESLARLGGPSDVRHPRRSAETALVSLNLIPLSVVRNLQP